MSRKDDRLTSHGAYADNQMATHAAETLTTRTGQPHWVADLMPEIKQRHTVLNQHVIGKIVRRSRRVQ